MKKKMCHNKRENEKTGGGKFNKYILTDMEESLARVSGIHRSVEGVSGAKSSVHTKFLISLRFSSIEDTGAKMRHL